MTRSIRVNRMATHAARAGRITMALLVSVSLACTGGDEGAAPDTSPVDTGNAAAGGAPTGTPTGSDITPQMVALGDSIFHGTVAAGTCFTCHGAAAQGTPLAPSLVDQEWINGDGSLDFIANVIRTGVLQPKQHPAPMPPFEALLTGEQIRAVAAYVYSRSHPNVGTGGG